MLSQRHKRLAIELVEGKLFLVCPQMVLLLMNGTKVLEGIGFIRSTDRGIIFAQFCAPFTGVPHKVFENKRKPGEIYTDEEHVLLEAKDSEGGIWRSNPLIVHLALPSGEYWNVQLPLSEIEQIEYLEYAIANTVLHINIPNIVDLPFTGSTKTELKIGSRRIGYSSSLDFHEQEVLDRKFYFRKENDWLSIVVTSQTPCLELNVEFARLLCEAIEFALATDVQLASVCVKYGRKEVLRLRSGPFSTRFATLLEPPVMFAHVPDRRTIFWHLMLAFVSYFENNNSTSNPVVRELRGIRRGAQGSFQTAALTLAVAVESICRIVVTDKGSGISKEVRKSLQEHCLQWDGNDDVKQRLRVYLNNFGQPSATDLLKIWCAKNNCPEELISAWKKLRNAAAHGNALNEDQNGLDAYYAVLELAYRMVAKLVHYDGEISALSKRGWGTDELFANSETDDEIQA